MTSSAKMSTGKRSAKRIDNSTRRTIAASATMEEAARAGLLDGDSTEHVSFRAPKALLDAARRESGVTRPTELGLLGLAMLAQPDPTARFMQKTRGALGPDHRLDY